MEFYQFFLLILSNSSFCLFRLRFNNSFFRYRSSSPSTPTALYILQRYYPSGKLFQQKEQLNIVGPLYRCISLETDERLPPLSCIRIPCNTVALPSHLSRFRTLVRLVVYRGASSSCRKVISAKYDFRADLKFHDRPPRSFYTELRILERRRSESFTLGL